MVKNHQEDVQMRQPLVVAEADYTLYTSAMVHGPAWLVLVPPPQQQQQQSPALGPAKRPPVARCWIRCPHAVDAGRPSQRPSQHPDH